VTFTAATGKQAIAAADGVPGIVQLRTNNDGTAVYAIDLGAGAPAMPPATHARPHRHARH